MNEELIYYYKYTNNLEMIELVKLTLTYTGRSNVYICNYEIQKFDFLFIYLHDMLKKAGIHKSANYFMEKKSAIAENVNEIVELFSVLKVLRVNDPNSCRQLENLLIRQTMKKEKLYECFRALVKIKNDYAIKESLSKNIIVRKKPGDYFSGDHELYNDHSLSVAIYSHLLMHIYDRIDPNTGDCIKEFTPITAEEYNQKVAKFVVPAIITTINEY